MEEKFISIIIPTYNEENFLPKLLRSIRKQTYRNYEVIIADAKSKDKTREIVEKYHARVVEGGPVAIGRNNGAEKAKGDILIFLDADVVLPDPHFLEKTIMEFRRKKLDIATCLPSPISEKKIDKVMHDAYNLYSMLIEKFKPFAPGFCIYIKRSIHEKIGGFDSKIKLAEDHDYVQRAAQYGIFGVLKSKKIFVSVRRLEKDGRMRTALKYLFCGLHMMTLGSVKSDIFNYRFGYDDDFKQESLKKIMLHNQ